MTQPPSDGTPDNVRHLSSRQPVGLVPPGTDLTPEPEPEPDREPASVRLDRVVAAMAGVGFEEFNRDDHADLRGLARRVYAAEAKRLLAAFDSGELQLTGEGVRMRESRDWALVNRDTHYQRILQLEDENNRLRAELGRE